MTAVDRVLALSPDIRYVAVYRGGYLESRQRDGVTDASAPDSDRYEELLVNPTLLTLVRQRGNIDCDGAEYIVIRYGRFYQLVLSLSGGHVSVCIELRADPLAFVDAVRAACLAP